jgi:DNA repair photolyase
VTLRWHLTDEDGPSGQSSLFGDDLLVDRHVGTGEFRGMEFLHVDAKTILNRVPGASKMPFEWTINAYRGCSHSCSYCFARPTHEYLGLGIGDDFDTKIVVKVNAVERLRAELAPSRWGGHHIAIGTNTDPYQRCEGKYHLYRGMLEVLVERRNPFSVLTKSTLILRDLELLQAAAAVTDVRVNLSIGTLDEAVWKATEPGAPHPARRVDAVRRLNEAGIRCGVLVAPIIPGLSDADEQLEAVVEAVVEAGAVTVSAIPLHLRGGVRDVFFDRLERTHPELVGPLQQRYAGRAHLPPADQKALSARVRALVDAQRRRTRHVPVSGLRRDLTARLREQGLGPGTSGTREPPPTEVQASLF